LNNFEAKPFLKRIKKEKRTMSKGKTIHFYDYVNHPYEKVSEALKVNTLAVFQNATKTAAKRAKDVSSELYMNIGGIEVGTDIAISVKNFESRPKEGTSPQKTIINLEWAASKRPKLFPVMKAELAIYPLTATETQLDLLGNYEVPLGNLGEVLDTVVGHRVVEASIHRFINDVAAYLRTELSK
jgi:hypothetical protein